ncbi:unnamed protein product [Brassicogethes aeneus]|uniref:Transposase domain-containing protein n=1 Tax=Brassicogethes aeneus TaxID=1431903 RepID=A0A9P0AU03_BRAAE|nr:unnamed protein product [Brassicogethes aeneus]
MNYSKRHLNRLVASEVRLIQEELQDFQNESSDINEINTDSIVGEITTSSTEVHTVNTNEELPPILFKDKIAQWAIECNIAHLHLDKLLCILREEHLEVPKSSKTLLHTPGPCKIVSVSPGNYCHIGLEKGIRYVLDSCKNPPNLIKIDLNFDGVAPTNTTTFWPILALVKQYSEPFLVGLYHGNKKPEDLALYVKQLLEEIKRLQRDGMDIHGNKIDIVLNNVICDAPAKAYILNVKGHNSSTGCNKCVTEGTFINAMSFPILDSSLRTDRSFRERHNPEYHKGPSPLEEILNFDMIKNFPLDYMHLVLLGVAKKILNTLWNGRMGLRLVDTVKQEINLRIEKLNISHRLFARKQRSISLISDWKATEFRQFLLYTGPALLYKLLENEQYIHFLFLHVAIRILCNKEMCQNPLHNNVAKKLILKFVRNFENFYGEGTISYNVHNLIHISDDVMQHGSLDEFSAFPYENFMLNIKQMTQTSNLQLQQIIKRTLEQRGFVTYKKKSNIEKYSSGDVVFLKNDSIFFIETISESAASGKLFENTTFFYNKPLDSRVVGVFRIDKSSFKKYTVTLSKILCRGVFIESINKEDVVVKFLHGQ